MASIKRGPGSALGSRLVLFRSNLLRALGAAAKRHVAPDTRAASKTLHKALAWKIVKNGARVGTVLVGVPHYWAPFLHEGRKSIIQKKKGLLWYRDAKEDPRNLVKPYPIKRSDHRAFKPPFSKASRIQFQKDLASGRIILAYAVGPTEPKKFFTRPMASFEPIADRISKRMMTDFIRKQVIVRDTRSAVIDLRLRLR